VLEFGAMSLNKDKFRFLAYSKKLEAFFVE
jgi:hypothetical protein